MAKFDYVEQQLRGSLVQAAQQADIARSADAIAAARDAEPSTPPVVARRAGGRGPRWGLAVAAACLATIGGLTVWGHDGAGETGEASCAAVLRWRGADYVPLGDLTRVPRPARQLERGTALGCDDGNGAVPDRPVQVSAVAGVDPSVAVLAADGDVYVPAGTRRLPAEIRVLTERVSCTLTGDTKLRGGFTGVRTGERVQTRVSAPYVASFVVADSGPDFPFGAYSQVTLSLRVTEETAGGDDPKLLTRALQAGAPVEALVRCQGRRFVASGVRLAR